MRTAKTVSNPGFRSHTVRTPVLRRPVLVLNLSYEPFQVTTVRRAVLLYWKEKVTIEEIGDGELHTVNQSLPVPSVVRLRRYVPRFHQRGNIFRRLLRHYPQLRCQYCERELTPDEVTWDHIVPRSRGGQSRWSNLAIACSSCNHYKGNRLPEEAGLKLFLDPRRIPRRQLFFYIRWLGLLDERWGKYIYYDRIPGREMRGVPVPAGMTSGRKDSKA